MLALVLLLLASPATAANLERADGVIGILPLPEVFGVEPCGHFEPRDIPIFRSPATGKPFGRIYVAKRWTYHKDGGCEGLAVQVDTIDPDVNRGELPTLEFAYEQPGAIVLKRDGSWFEIALHKGVAWVRILDVARFLPVERLLEDGLTYLRTGTPIPIHTDPNHTAGLLAVNVVANSYLPTKVLAFKRVAGRLWVKVESLRVNPCTEEKTSVAPVTGWLPFHDSKGQPTVWFHSRGC